MPATGNPDEPRSLIEKIGSAVAVGLTALAAVFGSMSAGQLQQAMYCKSQAAQDRRNRQISGVVWVQT
ncbi:MAG: hypothetical protein U0792_02920 [Gemmataceae bacterium]